MERPSAKRLLDLAGYLKKALEKNVWTEALP